jgi:hypothetical protein
MIPPYPLAWPEGMPRTARPTSDPFKTSLGKAVQNVTDSLRRLGSDSGKAVTSIVVTSNVAGLGAGVPSDRGIAAWFEWDGEQRCIAVDRYGSLEGNVQAIHHVVEAHRALLRHGGLNVLQQTFKGFTALPAPDWRRALGIPVGIDVTEAEVRRAYDALARTRHPDKPGGSHDAMAELNQARDRALAELKGR